MRVSKKRIDEKHEIESMCIQDCEHQTMSRIVKTTNGQVIMSNEPTILFRGRDRLAVPMLMYYRELCVKDGCNDFQLESMDKMIKAFVDFANDSPTMKQPGITRGL